MVKSKSKHCKLLLTVVSFLLGFFSLNGIRLGKKLKTCKDTGLSQKYIKNIERISIILLVVAIGVMVASRYL